MRLFPYGKIFRYAVLTLFPALLLACSAGAAPAEISIAAKFTEGQMTPDNVRAMQGDTVTLQIESDSPGTFHLHGYDLEGEATAAESARIQFVANATGRFPLTFHGGKSGQGAMEHGPVEATAPVSVDISAATVDDGAMHVAIETEGWRWAPEEVNGADAPGAGHAHIYADGKKLSRVYGPYHYLPSPEPGQREIRILLNTNQHRELAWQGAPVESTITVNVPDSGPAARPATGPASVPVVSESPLSLKIVIHPDELGGYNLQVMPSGFEFAPGVGLAHRPGQGYAELAINDETVTRLYTPWLQVPAQGEGTHTFTVTLLNNEGRPYEYDGAPVAASAQVHEEAKSEESASGADHHGQPSDSSDANTNSGDELEVGYVEVQPR